MRFIQIIIFQLFSEIIKYGNNYNIQDIQGITLGRLKLPIELFRCNTSTEIP